MYLQLAGVGDCDCLGGLAGLRANSLDFLDDVHALNDFAEHNVLAIEPAPTRIWHVATCDQAVFTVQRKNCEPLVPGPALAMDRTPSHKQI
jgi:hypothetical protein